MTNIEAVHFLNSLAKYWEWLYKKEPNYMNEYRMNMCRELAQQLANEYAEARA